MKCELLGDCGLAILQKAAATGKNSAIVLSHLEKSMKNDPQLALDFMLSTPLDMGAFDLSLRYTSAYVVSTS